MCVCVCVDKVDAQLQTRVLAIATVRVCMCMCVFQVSRELQNPFDMGINDIYLQERVVCGHLL